VAKVSLSASGGACVRSGSLAAIHSQRRIVVSAAVGLADIYWQLDVMIADIWRVPQNPETVVRPGKSLIPVKPVMVIGVSRWSRIIATQLWDASPKFALRFCYFLGPPLYHEAFLQNSQGVKS
jgi:hypothetical protein